MRMKKLLLLTTTLLLSALAMAQEEQFELLYEGTTLVGFTGEMPENTSINVNEGTVYIASEAFYGQDNLVAITFPESLKEIGAWAFNYCGNLKEITIPKNVKTFGTQIFYKASNLKSINYKSNYSPSDGDNIFSLSHIENIIFEGTKIPSGILKSHQNIKTVTIANSVKLIEKDAFYKCNGISEVYFTGTIAEWCEIQFKISSTVNNEPQVESNPIKFTDKFYIQNQLVDSVTLDCSINDYAFAGYLGLTNVVIGEKSKDIGKFVFYDCINLKTVDIRNGLTYLNDNMFWGCENLESITIPKSITTIKGTPFVLCEKLTSVYISDIEAWCNITNTVTDGYGMIPWDYSEVAKLYLNGDLITELIIPDTVTTIKRNRFSHCVYIEKIVIPDSVSNIGIAAFEGCNSLKYLVILDGVTGIEARAFGGCTALESIIVENNSTRALNTIIFRDYLRNNKDALNEYEKDNLAYSSKLMTLECGIRFLDDYLDGDNYFKIHREKHNLDRCRTQFKLVKEMEEKMGLMNEIVKKYL